MSGGKGDRKTNEISVLKLTYVICFSGTSTVETSRSLPTCIETSK